MFLAQFPCFCSNVFMLFIDFKITMQKNARKTECMANRFVKKKNSNKPLCYYIDLEPVFSLLVDVLSRTNKRRLLALLGNYLKGEHLLLTQTNGYQVLSWKLERLLSVQFSSIKFFSIDFPQFSRYVKPAAKADFEKRNFKESPHFKHVQYNSK